MAIDSDDQITGVPGTDEFVVSSERRNSMTPDDSTSKDDGKRAVILIHGMGETEEHGMLFKVTDAIADWMPQHLKDEQMYTR